MQSGFESKDCHPRMKIRMTAIILCDNYCVGRQFSSVEMQLDVAPINDLHSEKLQLDVYVLD